jgi:putative flavoprotein involved in K+ transport
MKEKEMTRTVGEWLEAFAAALAVPASADWPALFVEDCYWRDLVAVTWSIETIEGRDAIAAFARRQMPAIAPTAFELDDPALQLTD